MRTARKAQASRARRARARALQDYFIDKWMEYRNIREGMAASGINWHQIQAWRRWDREFRTVFDGCKAFAREMQLDDFQTTVCRKSMAGSHRATDQFMRLFFHDRLCPICQRRKP